MWMGDGTNDIELVTVTSLFMGLGIEIDKLSKLKCIKAVSYVPTHKLLTCTRCFKQYTGVNNIYKKLQWYL